MKNIFLILFIFAGVGETITTLTEVPLLEMICKPALMITLGLYYVTSQHEGQQPLAFSLMLAIIFSCIGDVLLMLQHMSSNFFMFGLAAFLIAHVFYILTYKQHQQEESADELRGLQKLRFSFPIILSGTGLVTILYNHLGDLKIPVVIYAAVLTYMVVTALFRFGKTTTASFTMVFGGAILFMISDSLIAISKFLDPIEYGRFWIMSTYIGAQFLIVKGLLKHPD